MSDLGTVNWEVRSAQLPGRLRLVVDLFVRGLLVHAGTLQATVGEKIFATLRETGLIEDSRINVGSVYCPVWLYPADGFVVASDRRNDPEGGSFETPEDVVFPGIYGGTLRFLRMLPDAAGSDALDLCGGSGIGAFHLARTAKSAATSDLTPRAARFAEFNARLNGLAVESLCGDLYQPLNGRQFDVITAHPPFVPSTGKTLVYRDAGETGEDVTRGIITGLADHLRPGGCCMITCIACDTRDQTFEQRVKDWLGAAREEFDVIFGLEKVMPVDEVLDSIRKRGQHVSADQVAAMRERLQAAGTRQFVYGTIWLERLRPVRPLSPIRVRITPAATAADFHRLRMFRRERARPDFFPRLAAARPAYSSQSQLTVRHVPKDGLLVPVEFMFTSEGPLNAAFRPDGWVVPLLARLNGSVSVSEVFRAAADSGELPEGFPEQVFLELIATVVEQGLLEADLGASPA